MGIMKKIKKIFTDIKKRKEKKKKVSEKKFHPRFNQKLSIDILDDWI